jgi:hypothetical protein
MRLFKAWHMECTKFIVMFFHSPVRPAADILNGDIQRLNKNDIVPHFVCTINTEIFGSGTSVEYLGGGGVQYPPSEITKF